MAFMHEGENNDIVISTNYNPKERINWEKEKEREMVYNTYAILEI